MVRSLFLSLLALAALSSGAVAQAVVGDVELLGRVYGTRPPAAYFELRARDPDAFEIQRGWRARMPTGRTAVRRGAPAASGGAGSDASTSGGPAAVLGPRQGAVQGTVRFPLVLGLFSDSPVQPPFTRSRIQTEFFDGPNSYYRTIPEFYHEMSGGRIDLVGQTHGWVRATLSQSQVVQGQSALPGRIGGFIVDLLSTLDDGSIDWGQYDNDGPDGIPNSGDDDGFVDFLAVMHPTQGAECDGSLDRVWSHKYTLQAATGMVYHTKTPAANGGTIKVNDYTVQPAFGCPIPGGAARINEIGVFAHELGHAFGLPDLYCTTANCSHAGIGRWGLMGSGSWGCSSSANTPERPCHMSAWEKVMLGWADVETLPPGADLGVKTLAPVVASGRVLRVDVNDGSGDYFLLENRQPLGFDQGLPGGGGLLAWRIDQHQLDTRWQANTVNTDRSRMGVSLLQADGRNDLGGGRTGGDAGDPFPGSTGNTALHTGTQPSTHGRGGAPSGLTILDIARVGQDMHFRALTRFQDVVVRSAGVSTPGDLFTVDGVRTTGSPTVVRAAPFQTVSIVAAPGAPLGDGLRQGFERWVDAPGLPATRTFVTGLEDAELVAQYGPREVQVRVNVSGEHSGVPPGSVAASPHGGDFWFPEGTLVNFSAIPTTGFRFQRWTGLLSGQTNPMMVRIDAPGETTAVFDLIYGVPGAVSQTLEAATQQELVLVADNGSAPVVWTLLEGRLPNGLSLGAGGVVTGAAMETGTFELTLRARDASGLLATGRLTLDVQRPSIGVDALVGAFLLGTPAPTELQRLYLDAAGNRNGVFDLGDLRVFLRANPGLPATAEQKAVLRTLLPTIMFEAPDGSGGGGG